MKRYEPHKGQFLVAELNLKLTKEEYVKAKIDVWTFLLNERVRPVRWLKATQHGTKVNFVTIKTTEDYELALNELKDYIQKINENTKLNINLPNLIDLEEEEDSELASCAECGGTFHETEINMMDYEIDLCGKCEKEYLKK